MLMLAPLSPLPAAAVETFESVESVESVETVKTVKTVKTGKARDEAVLPEVSVVGAAGGRYNPQDAIGASRTDTPLRELPQSVRVLPRTLLEDIGATRFDQTFDYASGVSRHDNFGGLWDNFAVRGFAGNENTGSSYLVDGLVANRGYAAPRDAATIERVEVLKGPTSSLYGSSEPGGTIHILTRQPQFKPAQHYQLEVGNHDRFRVAADMTGPLGENVAGRLIAVTDHAGTGRDFVNSQRLLLAPSLSWALGADTLIHYSGEVQRYSVPMDRGLVAIQGDPRALPRSRFLGEPNDGDIRIDSQSHRIGVEHQFSPAWQGRFAVAYRGGALHGHSTEPHSIAADQRTLLRQRRYRDYQSDDLSMQADVTGRFRTGPVGHTLLLGIDAYRFLNSQYQLRRNPSADAPYAIDMFAPVYGQTPPSTFATQTDSGERQRNVGVFVQDQLELGERWRVQAGVRIDSWRQTLHNRLRNTTTGQDELAVSPRLGVTWLATSNLALFANASRSFRPNGGVDAAGNGFSPERGRAVEAGIKFDSDDRRIGATLTAFVIHKRNVLTTDPADASFLIAAGEARSRGVELDISGQLGQHWRVSGNAALMDAEITADTRLPAGTPLRNIPRTSASVLAIYEDAAPIGQRYGIGGGVRHVGKRSGDAADSFSLSGYTLADLLAYWQLRKGMKMTLHVDNVFDRRYEASSYNNLWVAPGLGRTVRLGLHLDY